MTIPAREYDGLKLGPHKLSNDFRKSLRINGLKASFSRIVILELFNMANRPLSAQEIIEMLAEGRGTENVEDFENDGDNDDDRDKRSQRKSMAVIRGQSERNRRSALAGRARKINQATVYRTITSLKENGVIKQIDLRHNHAHYELAGMKEHHHLICLRCGRVEDVHRCGIEEMQSSVLRVSKHFAEIKEHALEFYGICKACSRKAV